MQEYYTVITDTRSTGRYETIEAAVEAAMRITLDRKAVDCSVQRICTDTNSVVMMGEIVIPGPRSYRGIELGGGFAHNFGCPRHLRPAELGEAIATLAEP